MFSRSGLGSSVLLFGMLRILQYHCSWRVYIVRIASFVDLLQRQLPLRLMSHLLHQSL